MVDQLAFTNAPVSSFFTIAVELTLSPVVVAPPRSRVTAPLLPGDSGGPLVNTSAQVIGMNAAASSGNRGQTSGDGFAIQTIDGHYLTAVGGGGRTTDVIHSDATQVQAWEIFRFNCGVTFVPNVLSFDDQSARNTINAARLRPVTSQAKIAFSQTPRPSAKKPAASQRNGRQRGEPGVLCLDSLVIHTCALYPRGKRS